MVQKLKTLILLITAFTGLAAIMPAPPAHADTTLKPSDCPSRKISTQDPSKCAVDLKLCSSRKALKTDDSVCVKLASDCPSGKVDKNKCLPLGNGCVGKTDQKCLQDNPIVKDLNTIVNFLSGLVGGVVVGVIILGGIQYSMAGDKAEAVSAAKKRITNGVLALVAFLFIFAFLQWLIPGGVFG